MRAEEQSANVPCSNGLLPIRVFGLGGAGCNAVEHLARKSDDGLSLVAMNTDAQALALSPVEKLSLGLKITHGFGSQGDPERGRAAAEEDAAKIQALCAGASVVFVVAGLGGGTGTGAAPVVARLAKEAGALVLAIVILPFDCEGNRRMRQARIGLHLLKGVADMVICLPNQESVKLLDENTSLLEAFQLTNKRVAQGVRSIYELLSEPTRVELTDICAGGENRPNWILATADGQGVNRAQEATKKSLAHSTLDGGALRAASSVLVNIAGNRDLRPEEVNWVIEQLRSEWNQAHLIVGTTIDGDLGDRIVITVIARENSLIYRAKNGDEDAFEKLWAENHEKVHRFVSSRLPAALKDEAASVTNEAFGVAWLNLKQFREESHFHSWLEVIAGRLASKLVHKNGPLVSLDEEFLEATVDETAHSDVRGVVMTKEDNVRFQGSINRLSSREKAVVLKFLAGRSDSQVADEMKSSVNKINGIKRRSVEKLKKWLSSEGKPK